MADYVSAYTGEDVDRAINKSLTEIDTKADKTQLSNRNLLDNAWFTVNQRGVTSWTNTYGVDRWIGGNATGSITSNSDNTITIISGSSYAQISQRLELNTLEVGKTYTFSVITSSGIETKTFTLKSTLTRYVLGSITLHTNKSSGYYEIFVGNYTPNTTVTIRAVKLEVGSISTLHLDAPPNYAEELLKCQRYFYRKKGNHIWLTICGDNIQRVTYKLPTQMRRLPTIIFNGDNYYGRTINYDVYATETDAIYDFVNFWTTDTGLNGVGEFYASADL